MGRITAFIQHKKKYTDGSTLYDMHLQDEENLPAPILVRMTAFGGDLVLVERVQPAPETVKTPVVVKELETLSRPSQPLRIEEVGKEIA